MGNDETTPDGKVLLEHVECNAACDYAPVVMVNWEFFDNQTPDSARQLVDDLRAGNPVRPTRGPGRLCTWREASRILAGFNDDQATDGPRGPASLVGLELAKSTAGGRRSPPGPDRATADRRPAPTAAAPHGAGGRPAPGRRIRPSPADSAPQAEQAPEPGQRTEAGKSPAARRIPVRQGVVVTDTLTPVLTASWDQPDAFTLDGYKRGGGWQALPKALAMEPDDLISALKDANLRGRGGAGFPTGVKWSFLPQGDGKPHYLVVNADESEPGTCKDVPLMMADPQVLIEGVAITAYAIRAKHAFIYVRGEVLHVVRRLRYAVEEAYAAGYLGQDILGTGLRPGRRRARRGRRLHLRRGVGAAHLARGLPRPAPAAAAVPGRGGPVRLPDRDQQRGVDRQRPVDRGQRRGLVRRPGHREVQGIRHLLAVRARHHARASTRRRSASRCASCSTWPAGSGPGTG